MIPATFEFSVRVYFEDTDAGGVVFYANYLKFFERARTEWLRSGGIEQQRLSSETGLMFAVHHTSVDYHKPALLDDVVMIHSEVERLGKASVVFQQKAWRQTGSANSGERELLAGGRIKVACVRWNNDRSRLLPAAIPEQVKQALSSQNK